MKNFAKKSFLEKKTWGVLGKIQEFYSPEQFQDADRIVPLNANPLEAWDSTRSRYRRRVQAPLPNDGQQAGVVPQVSSTPVPGLSPTPTPSFTSTPTQTNTPTPSSTPYILPETPALWYDATNVGSIDYITSGGTDYVAAWRSIGTYQKMTTGTTINTMPIWSGSSQMPGSPKIVRWDKRSTTALRQFLSQRFDMTPIPQSGFTVFQVFASPGYNYLGQGNPTGLAFNLFFASGNTTGGFNTPAALNYNSGIGNTQDNINLTIAQANPAAVTTSNNILLFSATQLDNKFLYTQVVPFGNTGLPEFELNQSGGTFVNSITGQTNSPFNSIALGIGFTAAGVISQTSFSPGIEMAEIMIFNRVLSASEQEQVQDYLRDKWRYDEWASPVPTPTPTDTPNPTPTPSVTPTNTSSPTPSPSAPASGTTEALLYLNRVVQSGGTVDATASAATITLFTSLVSNGLWDKLYAMYPILGGVAGSHSINGRFPTSTAWDLIFNGGWTHSSAGMQPNGTNGYAETNFNPSGVIGDGNTSSLGIYVNLQGTVGDRIYDMGVAQDAGTLTDMWNLTAKRTVGTGDNTLFDSGDYPNARVETTSQASASGMTIGSVRSSTDRILYRDGSSIATQTTSQAIQYANRTLIIGAQKAAGIDFYSSNQYAFAFMGSGLTNTDIVNISSIINTYQTSLGRNTY